MVSTMQTWTFSLILDRSDITTELENALYENGCSDSLPGVEDGLAYIDFSRSAHSKTEAQASAVEQVERALGKHCVLRVEEIPSKQ